MKIITTLCLIILAPVCILHADSPTPRCPKVFINKDANIIFKSIPERVTHTDGHREVISEAFGVAYNLDDLGELHEIWRTQGWYTYEGYLSVDGRYFVRIGPWASKPYHEQLAIAFYDEGKLLKEYFVSDLVKNTSKIDHSVSHYRWRAERQSMPSGFTDYDSMFRLVTCDRQAYEFSVHTGEISNVEVDEKARTRSEIREEEKNQARLIATQMLKSQKDLNTFTEQFSISDLRAKDGSTMGVYFLPQDQWSGDFIPKENMPCQTMAELIFAINSNDVVEVGLTPTQVTESLVDLIKTPFIKELMGESGRIRLRAAGDRLHWDSEQVEEYILILTNNGFDAPPLKTWIKAIIDLPDSKKMISISHPLGSDFYIVGQFDLVKKESWRKEYLKITGNILDESSPYIDKKYCPVVDREGTLRLLKRATKKN